VSDRELKALALVTAAVTADRWLTVNEAAAIAGMKPNTMYTCCLRRMLPSYKIGEKMRRIKEADLLTWIESNRVEAR
jgi:excisionase family DNA binding protein